MATRRFSAVGTVVECGELVDFLQVSLVLVLGSKVI